MKNAFKSIVAVAAILMVSTSFTGCVKSAEEKKQEEIDRLFKQMEGDLGDYKGNTTEWNGFVPPKAGTMPSDDNE